jgi:hypothetical protein
MVSRPIVVIDPAAAPRRLCMGDLEVLGGLVEPGEDPAGGRVAAGDNPGRLRSEVAFVGCHMSGAPRGSPLPPPAAHLLYRLATAGRKRIVGAQRMAPP